MARVTLAAGLAWAGAAQACGGWNTGAFFETAAVDDVRNCLDGGAAIDARGERDMTPLHFATMRSDNPGILALLIDRGADPKARTGDGQTAWDLVQNNEDIKGSSAYWRLNDARF